MKNKIFFITGMLLILIAALACSTSPAATPTASPIPSTPTPTSVPFTPTPALPSYSDILATYPAGTELSCTDAKVSTVTAGGKWTFTSGMICPGRSQLTVAEGGVFTLDEAMFGTGWRSFGMKITLVNEVTIDGVTYPTGAFLTMDKNLKWVQVSGW